ncbi:type II toxin-antitoxin system PemK/MazF family toxin [Micromonospora cathayae]|uniref:Type II toxin-antitoxin system PemK/MazF family toxin n=1 Tax=Micromonospora cathayae TaxID=3028804 RepID=A0ABY7ZWR2_9ACTN|nr:type II toxin-antitoxin system PemK/MazF family toxin [Micromonospora sp. HUAS 3]WDZ87328.1 type II toxin-antitoxin system PemK/MazF family toxin [Micromonospora sp. HUAS 3]
MPEWLLWAGAVLAAVAAGWAWSEWRYRARRPTAGTGGRRPPAGTTGGRPTRPRDRTRPPRRPGRPAAPPRPRDRRPTPTGTPRPGEIWWADVPFADGTGSKVRPCLVLRADQRSAEVLKITSQDKSGRDDHIPIPTRDWDPDADHDSFLDVGEPIRVPLDAFRDRAGTCDRPLWRHLHTLPHLPH